MKTYATEAELNAARARYHELEARIAPKLGKLRAESRLRPGTDVQRVVDHPLLRSYFDKGGVAPLESDIDEAVNATISGSTAADNADAYATRISALERNLGRPALPAERIAISRETGYAAASHHGAVASKASVALTNEAIAEYLTQYEAATGIDPRTLTAQKKLDIANAYHVQRLAQIPAQPVTDESKAMGREAQTPLEKLQVLREAQSRGDAA